LFSLAQLLQSYSNCVLISTTTYGDIKLTGEMEPGGAMMYT